LVEHFKNPLMTLFGRCRTDHFQQKFYFLGLSAARGRDRISSTLALSAGSLPCRYAFRRGSLSFPQKISHIESVRHKLCEWRFITLLGPGGVGKTTLALAVAETMLPLYPDQVCFVNFAPLSDAALVSSTVALALG
jgi:ABC-type glutathione transport system ATPase component